MYRLQMVLRNLIRHRRRNGISCLLMAAVLSVAFCGFYYADTADAAEASLYERYGNRVTVAFRDELQYEQNPSRSSADIRWNGTSTTDGVPDIFFDDAVMQAYNHPYPVTREMFERLGRSEYCEDYALAYAAAAYGFTEGELPERVRENLTALYAGFGYTEQELAAMEIPTMMITEHTVVGGSLDAFTVAVRENASVLYDFILAEGKEPGPGECVVTDYYAWLYGKQIGDDVILRNPDGSEAARLTVSGIYRVYMTDARFETADPDAGSAEHITGDSLAYDFSGLPSIGTPYDRLDDSMETMAYLKERYPEAHRISGAMLAVIHTDFDTAYHLYGTPETDENFAERHHFNRYFAYYNLHDIADAEAFSAEMREIFPAEFSAEFTVYPFRESLTRLVQQQGYLRSDAHLLLRLSLPLAAFIFLIVSLIQIRERARETGIFLSLGITETDTVCTIAAENALTLLAAGILAAPGGLVIHHLVDLAGGDSYKVTMAAGGMTLAAVIAGFLLTAGFAALHIRIKSPIKLIRQEG